MDILIIGNGFDLVHGLKTSYKDFLENCSKKTLQEVVEGKPDYKNYCETNLWMKHFITRQNELGDTWIDLETEIYRVIEKIKDMPALRNFGSSIKLCPQLLTISKDVYGFKFDKINDYLKPPNYEPECGIKDYTTDVYTKPGNNFYVYIKSSMGFINFLYDQLREFTIAFENYLNKRVLSKLNDQSKYQLSLQAIGVEQGSKDVRVLSFNYTDTCERLYKHKFNTYCELKIKPLYVHGKVCDSDDCNLVLGTHSFDNKSITTSSGRTIPAGFNVFKKHNQRHRYKTIEAYQDLLRELTDTKKIIKPVFHVIGHSLDKTDHNILKYIFLTNKNAVINIYYHNEEAQERLINNITEIIGEEEVMAKVRFIYQHDEKRGVLRLKN